MERMDVDEVMVTFEARIRDLGVPTAVVVIGEYMNPEDGEVYLWAMRDTKTAVWRHLGMATAVADDFRRALSTNMEDSDDA